MTAENTDRLRCVVCHTPEPEVLCTTAPLPVFQGCVAASQVDDRAVPMRWEFCGQCGTTQLANPMPVELVYQAGHATGLGAAWDAHHAAFASFVCAHRVGEILEVGGGGGKLARFFRAQSAEPLWHILEPNPLITGVPIPRVNLMPGFLDSSTTLPPAVQTVVFCHSLEHIYDIADMVDLLGRQIPRGGRVLLAWPDLAAWIARGEPGALNWEHTFYVSIEALVALFERSGFVLAVRERFGTDHSVFLAFETQPVRSAPRAFETPAADAGGLVERYFAGFERRATELNRLASMTDQPIYVAPASVYAQYLFAFGLRQEQVVGLLDNSPLKQGKRLYGTRLPVLAPAQMSNRRVTIFLNGGAHTAEMTAQLLQVNPNAAVVSVAAL